MMAKGERASIGCFGESHHRVSAQSPEVLSAALWFAEQGCQVIPAHRTDKRPITSWSAASDAEEDVRALFTTYPSERFGILTGPQHHDDQHDDGAAYYGSGLWVLDFDGDAGLQSLDLLEKENGAPFQTFRVRTPSGGVHLYFAWIRHETGVISRAKSYAGLPGVDTRGYGGFVICPPSADPRGAYYIEDACGGFSPAPQALLARLRGACRLEADAAPGPSATSVPGTEKKFSGRLDPGAASALLDALDFLDPAKLGYSEWRDVAFALSDSGLPWAEDVFMNWCRRDAARFDDKVPKIWEAIKNDKPANVTYRTVLQMAEKQGWQNAGFAYDQFATSGSSEWEEPVPLVRGTKWATLNYQELIPPHLDWLRRFIGSVATTKDVPSQMVLMSAMPALAMVTSAHFEISVPGADWTEPLMLWALTISESSSRKTPVIDRVTLAIDEWRKDKTWQILQQKLIQEAEALELEMKQTAKKLVSPATESEEEQLKARMEDLSIQFNKASRKANQDRTVMAADLNPQSLILLLQRNGGRLFFVDSEGDGLKQMVHGHTGQEPMLGAWLRTYDRGRIEQIRIKGTRTADPADVSMSILTQPAEVSETITDERARGRGLFARFMICYQQPFLDSEFLSSRELHAEDHSGWDKVIRHFLDKDLPEGPKQPISLSPGALHLFREYGEAYRVRLNQLVDVAAGTDERDPWQRKLPGRLLRIAGVMAAVGEEYDAVSQTTMEHALRWGAPLEKNYFSAIGRLETSRDEEIGTRVLNWILGRAERGQPVKRATHAAIYQGVRKSRRDVLNVAQVDGALELLTTTQWLRPDGKLARGMQSQHYHAYVIHPQFSGWWTRAGWAPPDGSL